MRGDAVCMDAVCRRDNDSSADEGTRTRYLDSRTAKVNQQMNGYVEAQRMQRSSILRSCTVYINGNTGDKVSDYRLKQLVVAHGGRVAYGLARRSVTHVILGPTGLATSKMQHEQKISGIRIHFVNVHWVLDSIAAGRRKLETPYSQTIDRTHQPLLLRTPSPTVIDLT